MFWVRGMLLLLRGTRDTRAPRSLVQIQYQETKTLPSSRHVWILELPDPDYAFPLQVVLEA